MLPSSHSRLAPGVAYPIGVTHPTFPSLWAASLFFLCSFRHSVLNLTEGNSQPLMTKLQWLFAFLEHSQVIISCSSYLFGLSAAERLVSKLLPVDSNVLIRSCGSWWVLRTGPVLFVGGRLTLGLEKASSHHPCKRAVFTPGCLSSVFLGWADIITNSSDNKVLLAIAHTCGQLKSLLV